MAHAWNGCSQSSRFLPQARRIVGSGDENGKGEIRRMRTANIDDRLYLLWGKGENAWNRGWRTETRHVSLTSQKYVTLPSNDFDEKQRLRFFPEFISPRFIANAERETNAMQSGELTLKSSSIRKSNPNKSKVPVLLWSFWRTLWKHVVIIWCIRFWNMNNRCK